MASNGKQGIEKGLKELPDLIICDLEMPELNGYEVAKQLKNLPDLQGIPLIAVTASAMVGDGGKILAVGFDGYIAKPIFPETFAKEIEGFLPAAKSAKEGRPRTEGPTKAPR